MGDKYPDTVLLAEANQWPEDVVDYFGDGDECHMAFHFPVMPRIFMAVRRESRYPVSEILAGTPSIPLNCQWGIFLRNHDELTLEMVTDEERDYMYAEYAETRACAPTSTTSAAASRRSSTTTRNQIELFTALLLSLPGSPVLVYYGDEIGMGDNIWLGDRDACAPRCSGRRTATRSFSACDPGFDDHGPGLRLPGHQRRGPDEQRVVAAALDPPDDRGARAESGVSGLGVYNAELASSSPSVLAFLREYE
ncbi:hypothetical protein ACU686_39765 [Yinghuangia aomiensis]